MAKMRLLRWRSKHTRKDKIKNECIRGKVRVVPIEEKMVRSCLRWFRHMGRRPIEDPYRRVDHIWRIAP